ncbi:hypothetical protein MA16_Dca012140 [Dendrobium catenatum]|uniref:Large ribosomal subunit protein uL30m n=1 Tax=Dendrobium catenatum TaxID=906689 RepID=A0A2I0VF30_9ASPA|nr:hypothetical protein MA16_Dca012140 [Dendrobium catenatum]
MKDELTMVTSTSIGIPVGFLACKPVEDKDERKTYEKRKQRSAARMSGSAFNAFKARVPVAWSPRLFITLVRGLPGTRKLHRRTLAAMRLRRCNRTVVHRTTPSLLGMLNQVVKRLVVVETEEMHNTRKQEEVERTALRPPIVVKHAPPTTSTSSLEE